eukprot:tig00020904_g15240.t1
MALASCIPFPLHRVARDASPNLLCYINALLKNNPERAKEIDHFGSLALHDASESASDIADMVVSALLDAFPDGAAHLDGSGFVPLMLACLKSKSSALPAVVRILLRAYPEAVSLVHERTGRTPLHFTALSPNAACARRVARAILEVHPAGVGVPDRDGNLPVHLACRRAADGGLDVARVLLAASIDSLIIPNAAGETPHALLTAPAAPEEAQALAKRAHAAWTTRNWDADAVLHAGAHREWRLACRTVLLCASSRRRRCGDPSIASLPHEVLLVILRRAAHAWPVEL